MSAILTLALGLGGLCFDIAPEPVPRDGITLSPVQETAVAMVSEVVSLDVHPDQAQVRAVFRMRNTSEVAEELEVGFPGAARYQGWELGKEGLKITKWGGPVLEDFEVRVDGAKVEATCKQPPGTGHGSRRDGVYPNWYLWPMRFEPGKDVEVTVSYRVPTRDVNYTPEGIHKHRQVTYILKTGAGWHGPIGRAEIRARFDAGLSTAHVTTATPTPSRRTEELLEWVLEAFEPTEDIVLGYRIHLDDAQALETFEARHRAAPEDVANLVDLALAREGVGKLREAAEAWRRVAEQAGESDTTAANPYHVPYVPAEHHAARCYLAVGDRDAARAIARSGAARLERLLARAKEGPTWWILNKMYRTTWEALRQILAELEAWSG